jgi:hypothetical protein
MLKEHSFRHFQFYVGYLTSELLCLSMSSQRSFFSIPPWPGSSSYVFYFHSQVQNLLWKSLFIYSYNMHALSSSVIYQFIFQGIIFKFSLTFNFLICLFFLFLVYFRKMFHDNSRTQTLPYLITFVLF